MVGGAQSRPLLIMWQNGYKSSLGMTIVKTSADDKSDPRCMFIPTNSVRYKLQHSSPERRRPRSESIGRRSWRTDSFSSRMPPESDLASSDADLHSLSSFQHSFRRLTNLLNSSHQVMSVTIIKSLNPYKTLSAEVAMSQEQALMNWLPTVDHWAKQDPKQLSNRRKAKTWF